MAATPPNPPSGTPPDKGPVAPVAGGTGAGQPAPAPAAPVVKPALFGGHAGGKKTTSGFPVGSPQHRDWVRAQDRERKRKAAEAARAAETPPPLPPAGTFKFLGDPKVIAAAEAAASRVGAVPPGATPPPAGDLVSLPGAEGAPVVNWFARDIEPVVRELLALTEEISTKHLVNKCHKARLPQEIVREMERDLRWADRAKKMVEAGASELFAKYLNESNVPVEVRPWIMIAVGSLQISVGFMKVSSRLDKLIAAANGVPAPQPEAEKKAA